MWKATIITSLITGLFCAGFATVIDVVTNALSMWTAIALAFCSGFCGSLVAQLLQGKPK